MQSEQSQNPYSTELRYWTQPLKMLRYERNNEILNIIDNSLMLTWYKLDTNPYIQRYETLIMKREIKTRHLKENKVWKTRHLKVDQTSWWDRLWNIRIKIKNKLDLTQRENLTPREEDCQSWSTEYFESPYGVLSSQGYNLTSDISWPMWEDLPSHLYEECL